MMMTGDMFKVQDRTTSWVEEERRGEGYKVTKNNHAWTCWLIKRNGNQSTSTNNPVVPSLAYVVRNLSTFYIQCG
jgi:hypothetical protein